MALMWPAKDPNEVLDYTVNWAFALQGDTIVTSTWALTSGSVTIELTSFNTTTTTIWLGGGTLGQVNTLNNTITTAGGRTYDQPIILNIQTQGALSPSNLVTSGTYNVSPNLGQVTLAAYQRLQIRPAAITQQHLNDAMVESNLMQASWAADGIMWWTVELLSQPLTQGISTYTIPQNVIDVLDVVINNGSSDRLILPFSRTDYASIANPLTQGYPTSFWWDRSLLPSVTLWPVPDGDATYTMNYYAYTQTQDATFMNGTQPAVPNWWLDAYVAGLSHRLSRIWAPGLEQMRAADAQAAYNTASKQTENAPLYVTPGLSGYFR